MGFFDNDLFDFDHDGEVSRDEEVFGMMMLDDFEREMEKENSSYDDEDDEREDELTCAGLDLDDLEDMDEDERVEALEDAGLDPDDYDGLF